MAPGGIVVANHELAVSGWSRLAEPEGVQPGRYFLCRGAWPTASEGAANARRHFDPKAFADAGRRDQISISAQAGAWSEGFGSQPRASRSILARLSAPASGGVTQMWSSRRPRSDASQSRAR